MNKRAAKRRACAIAAALICRGGDYPDALYEEAERQPGRRLDNTLKLERAWEELIDELERRAGANPDESD